jgi:hypothetical protein
MNNRATLNATLGAFSGYPGQMSQPDFAGWRVRKSRFARIKKLIIIKSRLNGDFCIVKIVALIVSI